MARAFDPHIITIHEVQLEKAEEVVCFADDGDHRCEIQ